MPKAYSGDLRERVIETVAAEHRGARRRRFSRSRRVRRSIPLVTRAMPAVLLMKYRRLAAASQFGGNPKTSRHASGSATMRHVGVSFQPRQHARRPSTNTVH